MKTREDIIFEQVGLEGTLKNIGCYEAVLKAMTDFAKQEQTENCIIPFVVVNEVELCDHSGEEVLHQGNGFVYKTCADCGEDI